ncbi:MAG: helix-turn-helix domain-containing protein [Stellaceae bacterium]
MDWAAIARASDEEIEAQIAADADLSPVFTDAELARARRIIPALPSSEIKAIRRRLGLSQVQFARRYGFSVETVRNYEQGHRKPNGPARVLLRVIATEPDAVTRALLGQRRPRGEHRRSRA